MPSESTTLTVRKHAVFGGSSASRWLKCPGSTALIASVPAKPSSGYADEGTVAHELAARCLKDDQHPRDFVGQTFDGLPPIAVSDEMCAAVLVYLEAVTHELARSKTAELYVEHGFILDIDGAAGEVFGTNDAMVYHPDTGRLVVFDYKHGVGVSVSAEDNDQLKFYAAGAVFSNPTWKLSEVHLVIVQPRARDMEEAGAVKWWTMETLDLMEFQGQCAEAIAEAKAPMPKLQTGPWCKWCDAAAVCPAREADALKAATLDFADMTEVTAGALPDPRDFDATRLAQVLKGLQIVSAWQAQVQEYVEAIMLSGTPVPGFKVVEKIGRAKWVAADEDVASFAGLMFGVEEDAIRPRKLTTIGDAEKLLKQAGATKDQIDDFKMQFTLKESSGLTIAPESDRRHAVNAAQRDFGDVKI